MIPPPLDAPIAVPEVAVPDAPAPIETVEPQPAVEPAASQVLAADGIPPLPEVASPTEVAADAVPPVEELPPVPDIPAATEPTTPADIEIPAPEPESTERSALEVLPSVESPAAPEGPRYTRPFVRPPDQTEPQPAAPPSRPPRPTAPVFRPTPGMPIQTPPTSEPTATADATPAPPAQQPVAEPTAPVPTPEPVAKPVAAPEPKPRRPVNPFLSKDPKQKARRLARALVSDIIVYQPQKRQEALAAGTLKQAFDEEVKKSWEEYVEQVGEELANSTEFFKNALNEILAGGNEVF